MIFWKTEEKYFCDWGWTGVMGLKWFGKIVVLAQLFGAFEGMETATFLSVNATNRFANLFYKGSEIVEAARSIRHQLASEGSCASNQFLMAA